MILVPLMVTLTCGIFMTSKNVVTSLVSLLLLSLMLPMAYMQYLKMFWPCSLLTILMSTGLIVVFAYIVSLHSSETGSLVASKFGVLVTVSLLTVLYLYSPVFEGGFSQNPSGEVSVSVCVSLVLIFLLLFLVVVFIRNAYSKGGGFRKKF